MYCNEDDDLAKQIKAMLHKYKKNVKVVSVRDITVKEDSWQHDLYSHMVKSAR